MENSNVTVTFKVYSFRIHLWKTICHKLQVPWNNVINFRISRKLRTLGWLGGERRACDDKARNATKDASRVAIASCCARCVFLENILRAGVVRMMDTANFDTTTTGGEGFYRMIPALWPSRTCSSGWRFLSNDPVASSFVNSQKVRREQISARLHRENSILLIYTRHGN